MGDGVNDWVMIDSVKQGPPYAGEGEVLPQALGRLRAALDDTFDRTSRKLGLTAQQAELLCAAMSPAAVGELAHSLRCDRSNVSRLVDRASARGLLIRRGVDLDGRIALVELTAEGERVARRFLLDLEFQTKPLRAGWPSQRRRVAVELLNEISDALETPKLAPRGRTRVKT